MATTEARPQCTLEHNKNRAVTSDIIVPMTGLTIADSIGVIGGICGIASLYYVVKQTRLMNQQLRMSREQQSADAEWSAKFDDAVSTVVKIGPKVVTAPSGSVSNAYGLVFPDPEFRQRIERHLVHFELSRNRFGARPIDTEQLRLPIVQETIRQVLDAARKFKDEHSDLAKQIGL